MIMRKSIIVGAIIALCGFGSFAPEYIRAIPEMQDISRRNRQNFNNFCNDLANNMRFQHVNVNMEQQQSQMLYGQSLGNELHALIIWFGNNGDYALENNRIEYLTRIVRMQQIHNEIVSLIGGENDLTLQLQLIITALMERYRATEPKQHSTPRFA